MKKFLLGLTVIGALFTSCGDDDSNPTKKPVEGEITAASVTSDTTFAYGNYTLKGIVKVPAGVTVTFDAGSTITCNKTSGDNALVVLKNGKLIINGTADEPVVFTEASKIPGSWGGIIMYGDAPINAINAAAVATSEDGNNQSYGGTNAAHNGGSLKYVRVEYAGAKLADGTKENNAFTFYSVGSGTTLDHLVAYKGADDGYEFFGGTVSATNIISYGNYDDSFDWQDGWQGQNNANWYAYQEVKGNFGMEIEACGNNNAYFPKVSNVTLKRATGTVPEVAGAIEIDAFQFKKQGNGSFDNVVIEGFGNYTENATVYEGSAVKIQDAATNTDQVLTSRIKITNAKISGTTHEILAASSAFTVAFPAGTWSTSASATGSSIQSGAWSTVDGVSLIK
jgi:hypothetical protein